jgi:hypothetical protein
MAISRAILFGKIEEAMIRVELVREFRSNKIGEREEYSRLVEKMQRRSSYL